MASCSQVSSLFQAYIDGELGDAEKGILEIHLRECRSCQADLNEQSAFTERVFQSLGEQRFQGGLRSRVLAHLPEMDPALNLGSHPTDPQYARRRQQNTPFPRILAAAAAVLLVAVGALLFRDTSAPVALKPVMGMITFNEGEEAFCKSTTESVYRSVELKSLVRADEEFETLAKGRLAMSLISGTVVKANYSSGFTVHDNRRISVAQGQTFFDVGHDQRLFNVETPDGKIVVFGTAFVVEVQKGATTLTVTKGTVLVSNSTGTTGVIKGNQLVFRKDEALRKPVPVDADAVAAWAYEIVPDADAEALFRQTLETRQELQDAIPAVPIYVVWNNENQRLKDIRLSWTPGSPLQVHCGYIIHVSDDKGELVLVDYLPGSLFDDVNRLQLDLPIPDGPISGVQVLYIKLVPDYREGAVGTDFDAGAVP